VANAKRKYRGLTVPESREIVQAAGVRCATYTPVFLIGPMCSTVSPDTADVLLKLIEDPPPSSRFVMWAWDLGAVRPTITSRCLPTWAPGTTTHSPNVVDMMPQAGNAVGSWLAKDYAAACLTTLEHSKADPEAWLQAVAAVLPTKGEPALALWPAVRSAIGLTNPQMAEIVGVWLHATK